MNGYRIETIISKRNESEIMEPKVFDPSLMENRFRHEFKYICSYDNIPLANLTMISRRGNSLSVIF